MDSRTRYPEPSPLPRQILVLFRIAKFSSRCPVLLVVPQTLPLEQLSDVVARVVGVEAPIHVDEIGRRGIKILCRGRFVASLRRKVMAAVKALEGAGAVELPDQFVNLPGATSTVRNGRALDNAALREVVNIAPKEIREAIISIIASHIGTDEGKTVSSVAKLLGVIANARFRSAVTGQIATMRERDC